MTFRRQDDAHPIWRSRPERPLLRADSSHCADDARHPYGYIRMGGAVIPFCE